MGNIFFNAEILGLIAGGLIASSTIPEIWRNIKKPSHAKNQSLPRTALLGFGNALWVVYGLINDLTAVPLFCGINSALLLALLVQQVRQQKLTFNKE